MRWAIAAGLAAALLSGGVAVAGVVKRLSPADNGVAHGALLRRADLGPGWTASALAQAPVGLTCPDFNPTVSGVLESGVASSARFQLSANGPFVAQTVYVYETAPQAALLWRTVVRPRLVRCVAASLRHGSGGGIRFATTHQGQLGLPKLGARRSGYRVAGTATTTAQTINVYLDMVVLARGRTLTAISLSSFSEPVTRSLELGIARRAAARLPA
jgi:hypothetical protein